MSESMNFEIYFRRKPELQRKQSKQKKCRFVGLHDGKFSNANRKNKISKKLALRIRSTFTMSFMQILALNFENYLTITP